MKNKINYLLSAAIILFSIGICPAQSTVCPAPSAFAATSVSSNSAVLSWNAVPSAVYYNVRYRTSPAPNISWQMVTVQTNTANLTGLLCNTMYECQVQAACSGNNGTATLSSFTSSVFFTTLTCTNACPVPAGLFASNITSASAKLNWGSTGATSYRIRYRQTGSLAWTYKNSVNNWKNISGLSASTFYEWQVRSKCVNGATVTWSAWSVVSIFQTTGLNTCPTPTGLTSTVATVNGVILQWNVTGAILYNIRYRSTNSLAWLTTTSSTNSKLLTGLNGNTTYEWQVQGVCTTNNGSAVLSMWSASAFFTTPAPLAILPNPANDRLMITHHSDADEPISITISDFPGSSFVKETRIANYGFNQYEMNVSSLKNGLYYLEISGQGKKETVKFFIQH
jgi:uncharacterized protein (DUF427 family)